MVQEVRPKMTLEFYGGGFLALDRIPRGYLEATCAAMLKAVGGGSGRINLNKATP